VPLRMKQFRARLTVLLEVKARQREQDTQQQQHATINLDAFQSRVAGILDMTVVPVLAGFCQLLKIFGWRSSVMREEYPPAVTLFVAREREPFDGVDYIKFRPGVKEDTVSFDRTIAGLSLVTQTLTCAQLTREKVERLVFAFVQRSVSGHE
jgi:hypothetical protein